MNQNLKCILHTLILLQAILLTGYSALAFVHRRFPEKALSLVSSSPVYSILENSKHSNTSLGFLLRNCPRLLSELSFFTEPGQSVDRKLQRLIKFGNAGPVDFRAGINYQKQGDYNTTTHSRNPQFTIGKHHSEARWISVKDCTAVVILNVTLNHEHDDSEIHINGFCDSVLIRGILNLIIKALDGEFISNITSIGYLAKNSISKVFNFMGSSHSTGVIKILDAIITAIKTLSSMRSLQIENETSIPKPDYTFLGSDNFEILVLLSGGVDSSLVLYKLASKGYKIKPYYIKIWLEDELEHLGICPWEEDITFAKATCKFLGVDLDIIPLQNEYWNHIISYTLNEARRGVSPNPDLMCNEKIKFGVFFDLMGENFKYIASGHYAKSSLYDYENDEIKEANKNDSIIDLLEAMDPSKDQTYFLSRLNQKQLRKTIFPIGNLTKKEVRKLAHSSELPASQRRDSQGLCFLGKLHYSDFIGYYLGESPGKIIDIITNQCIGRHRGLWFYTIGQRKAVGPLLNPRLSGYGPWEVVYKDLKNNILYVTNQINKLPPRKTVKINNLHWISQEFTHALYSGNRLLETRSDLKLNNQITNLREYKVRDNRYEIAKNLDHPILTRKDVSKTSKPKKNFTQNLHTISIIHYFSQDSYPNIYKEECLSYNPFDKQYEGSESTLVQVRVRHGPNKLSATLHLCKENPFEAYLNLHETDRKLSPGQFIVIYSNGKCLGSGIITDNI